MSEVSLHLAAYPLQHTSTSRRQATLRAVCTFLPLPRVCRPVLRSFHRSRSPRRRWSNRRRRS